MARLLITLGTRDAAGAAAVDARGSVPVSTRRAAAAAAGSWATGRRWVILLALGWLVQVGLRVWFSRQQVIPLANPDETAYLVAARVLAGGPGADLSGSTLYQGGYPLLITPVYWFTSNPSTVYHAVLTINAVISALVLPLGYLACRRLGLDRPAAYVVAFVAALVPAGFFYSEYAMTDAVFVVITLAWLLTTHSWLTASSARARYANAAGSALLAAYAYAVHSRGLVMLAGLAAVGVFIFWRQARSRLSVVVAALTAVVVAAASWALNHHISLPVYPEGTRSLSGQIRHRLASVNGIIHVLELAAGQLWRLVLDSWGIAGIGLVAALLVIVRRDVRSDLRIMAALSVAVTTVIACTAPAALPPDQPQAWASGRYLDGMIIVFFLVGAAMLLRARMRDILVCATISTGLFVLAAVTVAVYIGTVPTVGFGAGFNFAEPAVVTQNWTQASEEVTATWSPGCTLPASISAIAACAGESSVRETWLVIWATAMRLTAATQTPNAADTAVSHTPGRSLRSTNAKPIHTASMTSVTAVASGTLACVQFWVTTAGSAKLNPAPNPMAGTVVPM